MRKVKINREDLAMALSLNDYDTSAYLDTETGAILYTGTELTLGLEDRLSDGESLEAVLAAIQASDDLDEMERSLLADAARIEWDVEHRYRPIPRHDSREGYRDMEAFILALDDEHLQELLETAIQGKGAFRRFKDVLLRYSDARQSWFQFSDERVLRRMVDWLASEGIEPVFE